MKYLYPAGIMLLVVAIYSRLPETFFQQDEWQTLAANIYYLDKGWKGIAESFLPTSPLSHFSPLARVYSWIEYFLFETNFSFYAWQSIVLHCANSVLLFYLVYSWLKNRVIAFAAGILFASNSISHQAVTWVAAANSYLVPTAFILLSLINFHRFLLNMTGRRKHFFLSLISLFISLLFHEMAVFLFLLYPLLFFFSEVQTKKNYTRLFIIGLICVVVLFIGIRIPLFFIPTSVIPEATDISRPSVLVFPFRFISLGIKSFSASLIPERAIIWLSEKVVALAYPQFILSDGSVNPFIAQSIVLDLVSYAIGILILCAIVLYSRIIKDRNIINALIVCILFIPLSVLPYAFVLGKAGFASIFEPKFLYIPSIGLSILVGIVLYTLYTVSKRTIVRVGVLSFFLLFILFHLIQTRNIVESLASSGSQRKRLLTEVTSSYPDLPQQVVFYTPSNTVYYGMPDEERNLPVQIGFGKMLMIWYQKTENFPACLYEDNYLLDILSEGYKECGGRGFGYFRKYDSLMRAVVENSIPGEHIISFSWDGTLVNFTDITEKTRRQVGGEI